MRAGRALRRIIMDRIIDQVPDLGGRVYDRATEGVAHPYVTLGPSYWSDDSVDCIPARDQTVQIDIWHRGANKGVVEDITDDVAAALSGWADDTILAMHPIEVRLVRVLDDPDGISLHGVVQVEATIEE